MVREIEYRQIFDKLINALKEEYPTNNGVNSSSFEARVPELLRTSISLWNTEQGVNSLNLSVNYLGGSKFPDIIIKNETDNETIGLEVKYHNSNEAWTTLGNSVVASTMEENLTSIFLLFGHFKKSPPDFRYDLIEHCFSDIVITHKPRYKITMNESSNDFCKENLGISYNDMRALSINDRELFVNTYIANTKYDELSTCVNKEQIIAQCFILFPEIFSSSADKYKRMSVWLFAKGIVCRNTRDFISGNGKRVIDIVGHKRLPKIFYTLYQHKNEFKHQLEKIDSISLKYSWYDYQSRITIPGQYNDRIKIWLRLIYKEFGGASKKIDNTDYQFNATIKRILDL